MKLYYSPASCSLAANIVLHELQLSFEMVKVDLKTKTCDEGDFTKINPKGYVPALRTDSGEILTEVTAVLQYLSDQKPEAKLTPGVGTFERYRLLEWLNYVATEVHKGFGPLWNPKISEDMKTLTKDNLFKKFDYLNQHFSKTEYLLGGYYSIADAYLFTVLNWAQYLKIDTSKWNSLQKYIEKISQRVAVQTALKSLGLLKAA